MDKNKTWRVLRVGYSFGRGLFWKKSLPASLLATLLLTGCANADPDCGSSDTQNLIAKIAKDNNANKLTSFIIGQKIGQRMQEVSTAKNPGWEKEFEDLEVGLGYPSLSEGAKEITKTVLESAAYNVDTIRMVSRNSDTKAVSCAANLNVQTDLGGAHMQVTYSVELTTDGHLYATIFGLK